MKKANFYYASQIITNLDNIFASSIQTLYSNKTNIAKTIKEADVVIVMLLLPGASASRLITLDHLKIMKNY